MSRTYRRYYGGLWRGIGNRNRIRVEKALFDAEVARSEDYDNIDPRLVRNLIISGSELPPDPWDEINASYVETGKKLKKVRATDPHLSQIARKFTRNHKCTYHDFLNVIDRHSDYSDWEREGVIFEMEA